MKNIIFESASQVSKLIRDKKISSEEVVTQILDHIEKYDPSINAISDLRNRYEIIQEAKVKDDLLKCDIVLGPLHGVPITVKDSFNVKGLISSNGNPKLKDNVAEADSDLVARLKKAGAIIIGKTNLALYALDWQSDNKWFGRTNNPYDLRKTVGGSSGGSAASIASGFSFLELGSDAGGSIRVPAHFCGVCGLRTTESSLSNRGNMVTPGIPRLGRYLTAHGPLARNVEDLMLALEVLWNAEHSQSEIPPVPLKQYEYNGHNLKIAFSETFSGLLLEEEYYEIYKDFIDKLSKSRHDVERAKPRYSSSALTNLWGRIAGFDFASAMKKIPLKGILSYIFISSKYKDKEWAKGMKEGASSSAFEYAQSLELKDEVSDVFGQFFQSFDLWITPVCAMPALEHQKTGKPIEINGRKTPYTKAFVPFNFPTTIPGHPIAVIPIGRTKAGLPVGVQIHGQKWHDYKLLQMAKELESFTHGFKISSIFDRTET